MENYEDIINLPRPESRKRPKMSAEERAAQFAPFAALSGYAEVIAEVERRYLASFEKASVEPSVAPDGEAL